MTNELEIEVRLTLERLSKNVPQTERPGFHEFLDEKGVPLTRRLSEGGQANEVMCRSCNWVVELSRYAAELEV